MQNTNEPIETVEGQSPKASTGMSPVVKWLVGIIVLAGVGYGGYYIGKLQNPNVKLQTNDKTQNSNIQTPTPTTPAPTTPVKDTADLPAKDSSTEGWKTYENKDYGFSFKYPPDYVLSKLSGTSSPYNSNYISVANLTYRSDEGVSNVYGITLVNTTIEIEKNKRENYNNKYTKKNVNGLLIYKSNFKEPIADALIKLSNDSTVLITSYTDTKTEFDQILSTFKFTN